MTNPSGLAPQALCVNAVAPLFPRARNSNPDDWSDSRYVRDVQVYPRHIRETGTHQHMHRTAGVKHHLRTMAGRSEMMTTYEHDFSLMTRPKPSHNTDRHFSQPPAREATPSIRSTGSSRSGRGHGLPGSYGGGEENRKSMFASTDSKMQAFNQTGNPLRLSVTGWGDCRWSPSTHPSMILGMTDKRIRLQQTANIMNLRAPDVPFSTR
ncbi:unnamed protein product [Polarella glacialis]|uniref:Uncharacterized protein n=1 Tax=Polarella glacialis TaxID=89957 RepID=A0A813HNQ0_POLGL|nr:unnamed protein product [Polarella glacialis]CAE8714136.1 unnamed protein product [Polarella glacialis]